MNPTEENLTRLACLRASPIYFVDETMVCMSDLIKAVPSGIVRCMGAPSECVKVVDPSDEQFGSVAGWISEDA